MSSPVDASAFPPQRSHRALVLILLILAATIAFVAPPLVRGASLVIRAAGVTGWARSVAGLTAQQVEQTDITIPTRYGSIAGREYRAARSTQAVVLTTGVHPLGVIEPRLVRLARELAASGVVVVTPELPALKRYQLTSRATDMIEDSGVWLSRRTDVAPLGRPALMGISFSGGLSIVAAGRPTLRNRLKYVFSYGGHANLPRVLQFLAKGAGAGKPPHDYGVAILLLNVVTQIDGFVPREQVAPLQHAIERFLWASYLTRGDRDDAEREFEVARVLQRELPEPAATLMKQVNERDVGGLGPKLLPHLATLGQDPALSPELSPAPSTRVYLLHGQSDAVIPTDESRRLARYLSGKASVDLLVSPLLVHAEAGERATLVEGWKLIAFWSRMLRE